MSSATNGIGLLGGSFDPVHKGHVSICKSYLDSEYINRLIVILTPDPPHKHTRELTDFRHRLYMLNLALGHIADLTVSDIERKLPKPSYTLNTVKYFKREYPDTRLYLCIGEDSYKQFTGWYHWEEIIDNCTLLVASRPESGDNQIPEQLIENARFIEHEKIAISSSDIRIKLNRGEDVTDFLPEKVLGYIRDNQLYQSGS